MFALRGISSLPTPVGYSNRELTKNVQELSSGDFVGIAAQEFTLDELVMVDGVDDGGSTIRWMLPGGVYKTAYWGEIFVDEEGNDLADEDIYIGWADSVTDLPAHYTFKAGEGFFVKPGNNAKNPKLTSSGALYTCDSTLARVGVQLTKNVQEITSNPMPGGQLELDDIIMVDGVDDGGSTIRYMLPGGVYKVAYWGEIFVDDEGNDLADEDIYIGWADSVTDLPAHYTFKAGESYFVKPGNNAKNPYISYPNPLYVAPVAD